MIKPTELCYRKYHANERFFSTQKLRVFGVRSVYANALKVLLEIDRMYGLHGVYLRQEQNPNLLG